MRIRAGVPRLLHLVVLGAMAAAPAAARADVTGVIVPAYFYPGTGGPGGVGDGWSAMAAPAQQIPVTAIFNPNSGPLPGPPDPNYVAALTNLENAGGRAVAYVYTDNGNAALATVESQINTYITQYGSLINGVFLDGMNLTPSTLSYYQSLDAFIKGLSPSYTVIGNPGQPSLNGLTPAQYLSTADVFNIFEGSDTAFAAYPNGVSWFQSYPSDRFANTIYGVPSTADMLADLARAGALNAGSVYITDQPLNPPTGYLYDQLPSYWDQEVAAIAAVPEPESLALAATGGLLSIGAVAGRRGRLRPAAS